MTSWSSSDDVWVSVQQLWTKNRRLAILIARDFYIPGSESADVEQEAMIALWVAARAYDPEQGGFRSFASLVIKRHLYSCVKIANSGKASTLTRSVRTSISTDGSVEEILVSLPHLHQVVDVIERKEDLQAVIAAIESELNDYERACVIGVASGKTYLELGSPKKVDNTLFRARRKLRRAIDEDQ